MAVQLLLHIAGHPSRDLIHPSCALQRKQRSLKPRPAGLVPVGLPGFLVLKLVQELLGDEGFCTDGVVGDNVNEGPGVAANQPSVDNIVSWAETAVNTTGKMMDFSDGIFSRRPP